MINGEHRRSAKSKTRSMPLQPSLSPSISARKAPERSKLNKDLVLEVPRFPLTCRGPCPRLPAPWPGQLIEAILVRCRRLLQDSNHSRIRRQRSRSVADLIFIAEPTRGCKPRPTTFASISFPKRSRPHKHCRFRIKKIFTECSRAHASATLPMHLPHDTHRKSATRN